MATTLRPCVTRLCVTRLSKSQLIEQMDINTIFKKWFADYVNPTHAELQLWMKDPEAFEPMQDWDLIVGCHSMLTALVQLANNEGPQRDYIIHYLYVATASAFNHDRNVITEALSMVPQDAQTEVLHWQEKAAFLLDNPSSYKHKEWMEYLYSN